MQKAIVIKQRDQWYWADGNGRQHSGSVEALADGLKAYKDSTIVLLLPGDQVLLAPVDLPTKNPGKIAQALPYALEEHLLQDPEGQHCHATTGNTATMVAGVINKQRLDALLAPLQSAGIKPDLAISESLCIPWQPGEISLLEEDDRVLIRWGELQATRCDRHNLSAWLDILKQQLPDARVNELHGEDILSLQADHIPKDAVNALQGDYAPPHLKTGWKTWRLPLAAAALLLILVFAKQFVELKRLQDESSQLTEAISQQFRETFPHIGRMQTDPGPQILQQLQRLRANNQSGQHDFLALMKKAAPIVSTTNGVELESLSYQAGQLQLDLKAERVADIEGLRLRMESAQIPVTAGANSLDASGARGSLTIGGGAP